MIPRMRLVIDMRDDVAPMSTDIMHCCTSPGPTLLPQVQPPASACLLPTS